MPEQQNTREAWGAQKRYYRRQKDRGLVQLTVWIRPEHRDRVRNYINRLRKEPRPT